jgi:hypothetical protein
MVWTVQCRYLALEWLLCSQKNHERKHEDKKRAYLGKMLPILLFEAASLSF